MTERDGGERDGGGRLRPSVRPSAAPRLRVTVSTGVMPGFCGGGGAVSVGQVLSLLETSQGARAKGEGASKRYIKSSRSQIDRMLR